MGGGRYRDKGRTQIFRFRTKAPAGVSCSSRNALRTPDPLCRQGFSERRFCFVPEPVVVADSGGRSGGAEEPGGEL